MSRSAPAGSESVSNELTCISDFFFLSVAARKFKGGGTMSRRGIDRVARISAIFCSSSLAESRPCTHRTHVDHRIGLKIPFVAPEPCCTLGRAVLRRQDEQQQNCTIKSLVTVV